MAGFFTSKNPIYDGPLWTVRRLLLTKAYRILCAAHNRVTGEKINYQLTTKINDELTTKKRHSQHEETSFPT